MGKTQEIRKFYSMLEHKFLLLFLFITSIVLLIIGFFCSVSSSFNSLFINLSSGIITSIIFYLFVVEYPFYKNNRHMSKIIYSRIHNLSHISVGLFNELAKIAMKKTPNSQINLSNITTEDIKEICNAVYFHDTLEIQYMDGSTISAIQYIMNSYSKVENELKELFTSLNSFMDIGLLKYLNQFYYNVDNTTFKQKFFLSINDQPISGFSEPLISLNNWSNQLVKHNLKYYK